MQPPSAAWCPPRGRQIYVDIDRDKYKSILLGRSWLFLSAVTSLLCFHIHESQDCHKHSVQWCSCLAIARQKLILFCEQLLLGFAFTFVVFKLVTSILSSGAAVWPLLGRTWPFCGQQLLVRVAFTFIVLGIVTSILSSGTAVWPLLGRSWLFFVSSY